MTELHVRLDPDSLSPTERRLREPLEEQLSSALQAAAERVRQRYEGQSVDELAAELLAEARARLHPDIAAGFNPDPAELRRVAEAIRRG